ncbi:hypothetical protein Tco_0059799 [Tanacetum coccineum]
MFWSITRYGVSTSIGYGVSNFLIQYSVSIQHINTAYSDQLNTAYGSSDKCVTKSSTNELFTPYKEPEREFLSSSKLLKTLSLDKSRSPLFDLLSDLEESSEEEVTETMSETMEQYMSKTRADYGSGISMPKIEDKDSFKLKDQFLKKLHNNTFSGLDHEDAKKHI